MKVKALANLIYNGHFRYKGEEIEMDGETAQRWASKNSVQILSGEIETEFTPAEGLPDLITQNTGKKKK